MSRYCLANLLSYMDYKLVLFVFIECQDYQDAKFCIISNSTLAQNHSMHAYNSRSAGSCTKKAVQRTIAAQYSLKDF